MTPTTVRVLALSALWLFPSTLFAQVTADPAPSPQPAASSPSALEQRDAEVSSSALEPGEGAASSASSSALEQSEGTSSSAPSSALEQGGGVTSSSALEQTEGASSSASSSALEQRDTVADSAPSGRSTAVHDGFHLAVALGGGIRSVFIKSSTSVSLDGNGAAFGVVAGGAVAPNLILHGSLYATALEHPEVTIGQDSVMNDDFTATFTALGPGLTYYVMPVNVYLGGSLLLTQSRFESGGEAVKSEWGPGAEARLGKRFWLGEHTLLGFGVQGIYAEMDDQQSTDTIKLEAANLFVDCAFE